MSSTSPGIAESGSAVSPLLLKKHSVFSDCAQLFKFRVTSLVMMTAWAGFYMGAAKSGVSSFSWALFQAMLGIGLTSAGALHPGPAQAGERGHLCIPGRHTR